MGSVGLIRNSRSLVLRSSGHDGGRPVVTEVPEGSTVLDARLGQSLELALPGGGATGFRWEARDVDGLEVERLAARPAQSFGGKGREIFLVTPRRPGDICLQLMLRAPWDTKPAEIRELRFRIR
ncbi:protease inhibitor I42 family protein [Sphingobium sp. AEW010]|uniref:protease inhibitor I42 family protein n=1 Tax=unclassified Sphingobium TaxID=2611147 RepID=UPI00119C05C9|nr:putative secreted protein [Sphingobium sp. JAI105]TWC97761.1 putative secreted protein [Sphingobium sp. AEW010]TWD20602.1 putative secreted protein [Sphingobium sp. AEW001]